MNIFVCVVGDQSFSTELIEAFDTMLSALATQSQDGKNAIEKAGGFELTRLRSSIVIFINYYGNENGDFFM